MATKEEIMEVIKGMSVLELSDLVKSLEEEFGISAAAPVAVAAPAAAGASPADAAAAADEARCYNSDNIKQCIINFKENFFNKINNSINLKTYDEIKKEKNTVKRKIARANRNKLVYFKRSLSYIWETLHKKFFIFHVFEKNIV